MYHTSDGVLSRMAWQSASAGSSDFTELVQFDAGNKFMSFGVDMRLIGTLWAVRPIHLLLYGVDVSVMEIMRHVMTKVDGASDGATYPSTTTSSGFSPLC